MQRIAILSNVMVGIVAQMLKKEYQIYIPDGHNTWEIEVLNESSNLYKETFQAVFILLDCKESIENWNVYEDGVNEMEQWRNVIRIMISRMPKTTFFISNLDIQNNKILPLSSKRFERNWEYYWHDFILRMVESSENIFLFDLKLMVEDLGRNEFYSSKMWYLGNQPYSKKGTGAIANEINLLMEVLGGKRKKVLIVDLDNTIWGGVAGEDGIGGIELSSHKEGARYKDFQIRLKQIKSTGILLVIVSKNNVEDVNEIFHYHESMVLREDDFVISKINWDSKVQNIKDVVSELNIGLDSVVFIDDNPMEQEHVKQEFPQITVVDFPKDTTKLNHIAEKLYKEHFCILRLTNEDCQKTLIYQQETERKKVRQMVTTSIDYIKLLEIEVDIHLMWEMEAERVFQLCNKTNQFNLTTKRYTKKEILEINDDEKYRIFIINSKDKYGDNGLIGVVITKELDNKEVDIDTFLLSCRVMGRFIEKAVFQSIVEYYICKGYKTILAKYVKTEKNKPVKDLYECFGMLLISESDKEKKYKSELLLLPKDNELFNIYKCYKFDLECE